MKDTSREDQNTYLVTSRWILLRTRNVQTKVLEKIKTHFVLNKSFFFFENNAFYEIMWENIVEPDRLQMKIRRMRIVW